MTPWAIVAGTESVGMTLGKNAETWERKEWIRSCNTYVRSIHVSVMVVGMWVWVGVRENV